MKIIDQRYHIIKPANEGQTSQNFLVENKNHQQFLLKFLKHFQPNISFKEVLQNFKNEFSVLKKLNHPHVATIFDFGFDTATQKYYFTTEYIEGVDFVTACEDQPLHAIESIIVQVLRALYYLHSRGIYHLDLKPQNVVVKIEGKDHPHAKIINFVACSQQTRMGTPAYMAPEMIQGCPPDGRSDLYSLGVMIYKVLTGENPFTAKDLKTTLANHLNLKQSHPTLLNKNLPEYWDHILAKMLGKAPANRYSQASLVIRDINFLSDNKFAIETDDTKLSYLPEKGFLVAREEEWQKFKALFSKIFFSDKLPQERLLIIEGDQGTGKTRFLNEIRYYAQLQNIVVQNLTQFKEEERPENFLLLLDAHEASFDDVNSLVQRLSDEKCLIVWATEKCSEDWESSVKLKLKNYTKSQLKEYLESVTGFSSTPDKLLEEVFKRTVGNPLFVTEFVKKLVDEGYLYDEFGKWNAATFEDIKIDFTKIKIPQRIEDYLEQSFLQASNEEQQILKWLAVNKNPLSEKSLEKICPLKNIGNFFGDLIGQNLLAKISEKQEYYFKNPALADLVYNKFLSSDEKLEFHAKLSALFEDDDSNKEIYLYHVGHASHDTQAKEALLALGNLYLGKPDYQRAINTYNEVVSLAKQPVQDFEKKAFFKLGKSYIANRQVSLAVKTYEDFINFLNDKTDKDYLEAYASLIDSLIKNKELDRAQRLCDEVQKFLSNSLSTEVYSIIFKNYAAYILMKKGNLDQAETIFMETDVALENLENDGERESVHNNRLFEIYIHRQQYEKAAEYCQGKIQHLKKINNKYALAFYYYGLGLIYYELIVKKDKQEVQKSCIENFRNCEEIARIIDDYGLLLRVLTASGNICAHGNKNKEALEYYERALKVAQKISDFFSAAIIAYNLARIHTIENSLKEAYSYIIYAVNTLKDLRGKESPYTEMNLFNSYVMLADIFNKEKNFTRAHEFLDKLDTLFNEVPELKHLEYWKNIRRAQSFFGEGNKEKFSYYMDKAKELAKTSEEEKDFEQVHKKMGL